MQFSIIVPVYNAKKYLSECIESVRKQETKLEWELILVDDGSSDGSGVLCDEWSEKDARVRVIHQNNAGVSAARNRGLDAARGDYILFLDSDDYWLPEMSDALAQIAENPADMQAMCIRAFYENREDSVELIRPAFLPERMSGKEYLQALFDMENEPIASCSAYCYRNSFLNQNHLRFSAGVKVSEDWDFVLSCLSAASHVESVECYAYCYRRNDVSCMGTLNPEKWRDRLQIGAKWYRIYPTASIANGFFESVVLIPSLGSREETKALCSLVKKHRDVLCGVTGWKRKLLVRAFSLLGYYEGARLYLRLRTHYRNFWSQGK